MKAFTAALACAALLFVQTNGLAQSNTPAPKPLAKREAVKVVMTAAYEGAAPLYVAMAFAEFTKENLEVEIVRAQGSEALVLLTGNTAQVNVGAPSAALFNAIAKGSDIRIVAPGLFPPPGNTGGVWVSKAFLKGRKYSPEMLKGETLLTNIGYGSPIVHYIALELEKAKLGLKDVQFKQGPAADAVIALENGAVNFATLTDPFTRQVNPQKAEFVFGQVPGVSLGAVLFSSRLWKERRDLGEAFLRAYLRGIRSHLQGDYHENPKVMDALGKAINVPVDTLKQGQALLFPPDQPLAPATYQKLQELYAEQPNVLSYTGKLPDERVVDRSLLQAVMR
jgi:NitT/TauT family transport system substrate-binding protein